MRKRQRTFKDFEETYGRIETFMISLKIRQKLFKVIENFLPGNPKGLLTCLAL